MMTEDEKNEFGTSEYQYILRISKKDIVKADVAAHLIENCTDHERLDIFTECIRYFNEPRIKKSLDNKQKNALPKIIAVYKKYLYQREGRPDEQWAELKWDTDSNDFVEKQPQNSNPQQQPNSNGVIDLEQAQNQPTSGGNPPTGNDEEDENAPDFIKKFTDSERKLTWINNDKEKDDFPYSYSFYAKGSNYQTSEPVAGLTITSNSHLVLFSDGDDLRPFIETMNAIKANGGQKIKLKLNGTDVEQKSFAANALIASTLTGIELEMPDRDLADPNVRKTYMEVLKDAHPLMPKLIEFEEKKAAVFAESKKYQQAKDKDKDDDHMKIKITEIYEAYQDLASTYTPVPTENLQPKEMLKIFSCGINNIQDARVKNIATQVYRDKASGRS